MHMPAFPPNFDEDLRPGNLLDGEPPLPVFLLHSREWIPPDERERLETLYGTWCTRRAEIMVPHGHLGDAQAYARQCYEKLRSKWHLPGNGLPPVAIMKAIRL